jgi:predicted transcriptional regulator
VQGVRDKLAPHRALAYTTVMTMLDRLTRKQVLTRRKVGRSFVYTPVLDRDEIRRRAVNDLIDSLFDGSRERLLYYLGATAGSVSADAAPGDVSEEPLDAALL